MLSSKSNESSSLMSFKMAGGLDLRGPPFGSSLSGGGLVLACIFPERNRFPPGAVFSAIAHFQLPPMLAHLLSTLCSKSPSAPACLQTKCCPYKERIDLRA
jgi:hypothetical protein